MVIAIRGVDENEKAVLEKSVFYSGNSDRRMHADLWHLWCL